MRPVSHLEILTNNIHNMFNKLKQFKNLRDQAKKLQNELKVKEAEVSAMGGKIKIKVNGNQEVTAVTLDPEVLQPANQQKLQDGIKSAVNDAIEKTKRMMMDHMSTMKDFNMFGNNQGS